MTKEELKNSIFRSFVFRYRRFLVRKKAELRFYSGIDEEDAEQEIHLLIWEAISNVRFNPFDFTDSWIYRHVLHRSHRLMRLYGETKEHEFLNHTETHLEAHHSSNNRDSLPFVEACGGNRHYSTTRQVEARLWIEKAIQAAKKFLPLKERETVLAWLESDQLYDFSLQRTRSTIESLQELAKDLRRRQGLARELGKPQTQSTKKPGASKQKMYHAHFEIASANDLRSFTGYHNANVLLRRGMYKLARRIGLPFDDMRL